MVNGQNLPKLREEHRQLSSEISRLAIVSILLLFLLVMVFSRAFSRVNEDKVRDLIHRIEQLQKTSGEAKDLSYVFGSSGAFFMSPDEKIEATREETQRAAAEQKRLEQELESQAEAWFSIEISILGSSLTLDLRYWIALLPLLVGGGGGYLYVFHVKRAIVAALAARVLEEAGPDESSILDRLLFDKSRGSAAYSAFPDQIEAFAYIATVLGLLGYLLSVVSSIWPLWDEIGPSVLLSGMVATAVYVTGGCLFIRSRLWRQAQDLTGIVPPPVWRPRRQPFLETSRRWLSRLNPLRQPRRKLLTGGALILLTLGLSVTSSCENGEVVKAKGYELVLAQEEWMVWPTAELVDNDPWFPADLGGFSPRMDQVVYLISLLLAASTLVLLCRPHVLDGARWMPLVSLLAGCLLAYFLSDLLTVIAQFSIPGKSLVYHFSWILPAFLLARFRFARSEELRSRWPTLYRTLLVIYLPALFASLSFLFILILISEVGYYVFLLGIFLLARGYLQLVPHTVEQPAISQGALAAPG